MPQKSTRPAIAAPIALRPSRTVAERHHLRGGKDAPWTDIAVPTRSGRVAVRLGQSSGMPLLLLHGNSFSKDIFNRLIGGAMRDAARFIALDLPGHGDSADAADPDRAYTIAGYADAVIEVLEHLDLPHVAVLGWSLGGHVAMEVASRFPGVLGLMLCGAPAIGTSQEAILAGFRPSPELGLVGQAELTADQRRALQRLAVGDAPQPAAGFAIARTDGRARAVMFADLMAGDAPDQRSFVEETSIPVAVVNGSDDPIVDVAYLGTPRYSSLWYGRPHLIAGGGHAPFLLQPEAFDRVLARFLRSMRRRQRLALGRPATAFSG